MTKPKAVPWRPIAALLPVLALLTGCAATTAPTVNLDSEPTAEGLYVVAGIDADEARASANADISQYSSILLRGIEIEFRTGGETGQSQIARRTSGPYELTEEQQEEYRALAEQEIVEELSESRRFTLADQPGTDVLLVTIQLLDLTSNIPPVQIGRQSTYLNELGDATLVLELRDSTTDKLIARTRDRHTAENIDDQLRINAGVTNTAEIERMFRLFGREMRQQLDQFAALQR